MLLFAALTAPALAPPAVIVSGWTPGQQEFAVYACQGLYSRNPATAVYGVGSPNDAWWLSATGGGNASAPNATTPAPTFLRQCLSDFPRVINYNWTSQQELIPSITTVAGVLDAIPVEAPALAALGLAAPPTLAFDAVATFGGMSELESTAYVFDRWGNLTTGVSKLNPGWRWDSDPLHTLSPTLTGNPSIQLVDYVVKERLFNFFLKNGCVKLTAEHKLLERMLADGGQGGMSAGWPRPIVVYGYDNSHPLFGGDIYEAETTCAAEHNMGQVASEGVTNLAYFSSGPAITEPLLQLPDPLHDGAPLAFNASRTYVAFIIGDGDNVQYVQHSRADWMKERAASCAAGGGAANRSACYPLLWTLSPALTRLSPDWARWFFDTARTNGADWFVLPPSGDTYAYPSQQSAADQATFVARTELDCRLYNSSASVSWEDALTWGSAIKEYYPRYAAAGVVRSSYGVNVPYDLPEGVFLGDEQYKVLGGGPTPHLLFKPQEWRGEHCADGKKGPPFAKYSCPTAEEMAARLNGYKPGTVTQIYGTSDGGLHISTFDKLVPLLAEHVTVVNHNELSRMALAAAQDAKDRTSVGG